MNLFDNIVTQGNAYGIDLSTEFSQKKWSLSADYNLMHARNEFEELNYGQSFVASTDIFQHNVVWRLRRGLRKLAYIVYDVFESATILFKDPFPNQVIRF